MERRFDGLGGMGMGLGRVFKRSGGGRERVEGEEKERVEGSE
jgi:hypothetical protein